MVIQKSLPKLTGSCNVACTDIVTKLGKDRVLFTLYYPTEEEATRENSPSWLGDPHYAFGYTNFLKMRGIHRIFNWLFGDTKIPAVWNGKFCLPQGKSKLPVMIFSHGLGGIRSTYSAICSDLASYGTLVASVEHADESASTTFYYEENGDERVKKWIEFLHDVGSLPNEHDIRNKQVHSRADECSKLLSHIEEINAGTFKFVDCGIDLSPFKNAIDLDKCAILGHSFGGATVIATISKDRRFKVGVGLDTWMFPLDKEVYKKINSVPILFINSESFHWESNIANMHKLDQDTFGISAERLMVTLLGTVHQSQSDFPLLVDSKFIAKKFQLTGTTDASLVLEVNNKLAFGFIGKHLDLEFGQSVEDVKSMYDSIVLTGSNVQVDEERIAQSKEALRSSS